MKSNWRTCTLGDVVEFGNGKTRPKSEGNIPVYGGNGILQYSNKFNYSGETIIIGRVGAYCGSTYYEDGNIWVSDNALSAKAKESNNLKFLYYLIKEKNLNSHAQGSSHPLLTQTLLNNLEITIPTSENEQKAIAEILSSLDDKIDLLNRQNKTLENLAETLFRHYFIDNAKDDWDSEEMGKYVNVVDNRGKTPPNQKEITPYPVIEVNALGKGDRLVDYSLIRKYVDKNTFENWFRAKPKKYDILISTVGSIGEFSMFILEVGNIAQNVIALQAKEISPFYLYQVLKYKHEEVMNLDIGGVQPSIKVPHLLSIIIPIPEIEIQKEFDIQITEFVKKMETNYLQIQTLEKLRDTLLPKLISGNVRIKLMKTHG